MRVSKSTPGDRLRKAWLGRAKQYEHPCSHPTYGLIDCEKPSSGEYLCEMMLFARSIVMVVSSARDSCGVFQPSSTASRSVVSKRPSGLMPAPRPLRGAASD